MSRSSEHKEILFKLDRFNSVSYEFWRSDIGAPTLKFNLKGFNMTRLWVTPRHLVANQPTLWNVTTAKLSIVSYNVILMFLFYFLNLDTINCWITAVPRHWQIFWIYNSGLSRDRILQWSPFQDSVHHINVNSLLTPRGYGGRRGKASLILNLSARRRWVVTLTPLPFYHRGKCPR